MFIPICSINLRVICLHRFIIHHQSSFKKELVEFWNVMTWHSLTYPIFANASLNPCAASVYTLFEYATDNQTIRQSDMSMHDVSRKHFLAIFFKILKQVPQNFWKVEKNIFQSLLIAVSGSKLNNYVDNTISIVRPLPIVSDLFYMEMI